MTTPATPEVPGRLPHPLDYRSALCKGILAELARGRSCTIIGVGSSGKSNVARQLCRSDARSFLFSDKQLNMPGNAAGLECVLVDFQSYGDDDAAGLYSLFLEALLNASHVASAHPALVAARDELRVLLTDAHAAGDNSKRTRFCLGEAVRIVFAGGLTQLVFILDDFDNGLKRAPGPALNGLRALRDNYKGGLMYAAVMRREMAFVRPTIEAYEDFYELASKPVFVAGAFDEADAFGMLRSLAGPVSGGQMRLGMLEQRWLIELSGGHPGLLRKLYFAAEQGKVPFNMTSIVDTVAARNDIQLECELIWDSLDADEHTALRAFALGKQASEPVLARLRAKTLLKEDSRGSLVIFSPVFARFVRSEASDTGSKSDDRTDRAEQPKGAPAPLPALASPMHAPPVPESATVFNPVMRTVQMNGRLVTPLDDVEYHLLERLYQHRNTAVTARELLEIVFTRGQRLARRYPGSPETKRDRYMRALMDKVNLPNRVLIVRNEDGSYRFEG